MLRRCVFLVLLILCSNAFAATARDHEITMEDYFTQAYITDVVSSPDGKYAAYLEMRWEPPAETRNTDLWVVDAATGMTQRLTFDAANESSPQWSPDSKWIYFTASYKRAGEELPPLDGKTQVWRLPFDASEPLSYYDETPSAVTRLKDGIEQYELSKDGRSLYYVISSEGKEDEWKDLREKFDKVEYGHGVVNYSQLWKLDLSDWRAEKLIDDKRVIGEFSVTPDEKHIAMITTADEIPLHNEGWSRVDVWDAQTKKISSLPDKLWRADAPSPYGWLGGLSWSSDGNKLAFHVDFDGYPAEILVAQWKAGEVSSSKLKRPNGVSFSGDQRMLWIGKSSELAFVGEWRARARVYAIGGIDNGKQGSSRVLTPGDVVVGQFSLNKNGDKLYYDHEDPTNPGDVYSVSLPGSGDVARSALKRLTNVNPQMDSWKLPQLSLVQWVGANGDSVEGILELPPDYTPGRPLPMIVDVHGGPTDASLFRFEFWIYGRILYPAKGYALLSPNYRGSMGYGDKFLTDLIGHENDVEVTDILKGVDAMVARGIADSTKLGVEGWSNGGFLTNCLITKTNRFKAASSGAGVIDMSIQWGTEDTPNHVNNFMQGFPWKQTDAYRKASPLYNLDKVTTPTIIHVGGDDPRVPPANARTLYRALHEYLNVPSELIVYPGQGHGVMTYTLRKTKMSWDIAWFDKYVLGKVGNEPKNP